MITYRMRHSRRPLDRLRPYNMRNTLRCNMRRYTLRTTRAGTTSTDSPVTSSLSTAAAGTVRQARPLRHIVTVADAHPCAPTVRPCSHVHTRSANRRGVPMYRRSQPRPPHPCRPASVLWLRRRWRCLRLSVRLIDPNESATRPCDSSRADCGSQRRVLRAAKLHHAVLVVRVPARPPQARSAVSFLTSIRLCSTSVFSAAAHRPDSTTVTTCPAHRAMRSVQRCTGLSCHQRCGLPRSASKRSLPAAVTRAFNGTVDRTVFEDCHSPADKSLSTFR